MGTKSVISMERKTLESEASYENSKFLTEPKHTDQAELKVPVIYYLSTNGQLQHPHLIHVSISSPHGTLRLQDVINRLSFLRGQGIASMYSWSTKRNYRNGFVWQDLSENDVIYPSSSHEYVLKGTKLIEPSSFRSYETILSMPSSKSSNETKCSSMVEDSSPPSSANSSRRDYNLYNAKICSDFAEKAANASTQTEDKGRQRIEMDRRSEGFEGNGAARKFDVNGGSLSISSSSFGSLEGCLESADIRNQKIENERPSGRMRATQVLMQLVSCRSTGEELIAATQMVAKRALARLNETWKIIGGVMWKPHKRKLPRIVLVCCILQNIVIHLEDQGHCAAIVIRDIKIKLVNSQTIVPMP